jgi:hypothetical protein
VAAALECHEPGAYEASTLLLYGDAMETVSGASIFAVGLI